MRNLWLQEWSAKYQPHGTFTFGANSKWAGDKYVGEFKDVEMHGQGTLTFADGRRDIGEFKDGNLNGYAIQYRADGSIFREGIFKNGEFLYAQN